MKVTKTGTPSKKRLTIIDIPYEGGEVIKVGDKVYLYPFTHNYLLNYSGFKDHTIFVDLATGELVPLSDDQECSLIQDAEFKYNDDNLIEWV